MCGCTRRMSSTSGKLARFWNQIRCPVLLVRGSESWAVDPEEDGKASAFHDYTTALVKDAGHWVHHDQLDVFMRVVRDFLGAPSVS